MKTIITSVDRDIAHELVIKDQLTSPARVMHVDDIAGRALRRLGNIEVLASELRDVIDHLDGCAPRVNTRGLLGHLRIVEAELEAAVGALVRELGMVAVSE